ncbi:universal stress protein [Halovivax limisalsi]|uniref:universal stress protein n=1 Tax=Halovivax limisalsi TaxID=1453760 RepID=UPI001FFD0B35|nr:universal stress protein [Halovivax limisalsi]
MTVLVAFDGSDPAQKALEHAVRTFEDEEIVLLRVLDRPDGLIDAGVEFTREKLKELREETRTDLSAEVEAVLDPGEVDLRTEVAVGEPAREIVEYAEEHDVDHVVVGNHGRDGMARVLLGSVAEQVVRRAPMPVTVVR